MAPSVVWLGKWELGWPWEKVLAEMMDLKMGTLGTLGASEQPVWAV